MRCANRRTGNAALLLLALLTGCSAVSTDQTSAEPSRNGFQFSFDEEVSPWLSWMAPTPITGGFAVTLPGIPDVNHVDGIGIIYLVAHLPLEELPDRNRFRYGPLDLAEAALTVRLRGQDVDLRGGRLAWWIVTDVPDRDPRFPWQQTNWALTEGSITSIGPQWQEFAAVITGDDSQWTYAGHNMSVQGAWGERYAFGPVSRALRRVDRTLHLVVIGGPGGEAPTGRIEIDSIELRSTTPSEIASARGASNATIAPPSFATDVWPLIQGGRWDVARPSLQRLAADSNAEAARYLGRALRYGLGGPQDSAGALRAYLIAGPNSGEADLEIGEMLALGDGVPRDPIAAALRLEHASLRMEPRALRHRGMICMQWGYPSGCNSAALLSVAASLGDSAASAALQAGADASAAASYGAAHPSPPPHWPYDYEAEVVPLLVAQRWNEALPLLRALADLGHGGAALHAANALKYGFAGVRNFHAARGYYVRAAVSESEASVELAEMYINGQGGPRDVEAAWAHLQHAAPLGHPRAARIRGQLCLYGMASGPCDAYASLTVAVDRGDPYAAITLAMDALTRDERIAADHWFRAASIRIHADDTTLRSLLRYHGIR